MTVQEPTSLRDLDETMRREIERLLREEKLWSFDSFGWLNENDADPEFSGHAMWQIDAPSDPYLYYGVSRGRSDKAPPDPAKWQILSAVSGADFCGLMEAARMTIGLLLFQAALLRGNIFYDDSSFDLHRMNSVIILSTSSDRLRELFITTVFQKSTKQYERKGRLSAVKRRLCIPHHSKKRMALKSLCMLTFPNLSSNCA